GVINAVSAGEARASVYHFLGRCALYRGDYRRAIEHFKHAAAHTQKDPSILEGLGESLWRAQNTREAIDVLKRAVALADDSGAQERLGIIRLKLASALADLPLYEEALSVLEQDLNLAKPLTAELHILRSRCYLALNRPEQAYDSANEALTINGS